MIGDELAAGSGESPSVQFVRRLGHDLKTYKGVQQQRDMAYRVATVAGFLIAALVFAGMGRLRCSLMVRMLVAGTTAFVPLLFALAWHGVAERLFARRFRSQLPPVPNDGAQLVCVGHPADFDSLGPICDVAFEPQVFRASFGVLPRSERQTVVTILATLLFLIGMLIFKQLRFGNWWRGGLFMEISAAFVFAEAVRAFLWPTYLRVLPGRMDVLYSSPFERELYVAERVGLRGSRIIVNLRGGYAFVWDSLKLHEYSLLLMFERRRFAYFLFLGALSSYQPPPLPDDELLG